jgi:hypothetical protein
LAEPLRLNDILLLDWLKSPWLRRRVVVFPDFLGIGAQKAGTTWLHHNLQKHPEVWVPTREDLPKGKTEVHYFDRWIGEGLLDDRSYALLFERGQGRITGDITPAYSTLGKRRIHHARSLMPDAKIIFLMRNPVERTWSQTVQFFDRRGIKVQSLSESRLRDFFSLKGVHLRSSYLNILKNWQKFYPEEQFFVGFLEDIHLYPGHLLRRLYRFLGASDSADYRITRDKIFSRGTQALPTRLAAHLAQAYHEDLRMLEERFGGYVSFWLYCAERLINDPPAEEYIPYPLWESSLWEEWVSSSGESPVVGSRLAKLQSGPLLSITTKSGGGRA